MTSTPSVVLIHGLFGHLNDSAILQSINNTTVIAPDLLGYGANAESIPTALTLQHQADYIAQIIEEQNFGKVHLVGHSVGGAVAVLTASKHPELVASVTSIEGNFTLKDAFWSAQVAKKEVSEVEAMVADYRSNPEAWIADAGVPINDWTSAVARSWLAFQTASTVRAQAAAVVEATANTDYLESVQNLLSSTTPFHLIAGEHSRAGWDVPEWVSQQATSEQVIPNTGHLMMLESPQEFGAAVVAALSQ
ncbi:MAG: alpha/beta hydrolase [Gammaproteobacteria bacterium]|nr:alpha/beta hydrolase [Gammaproteobacteria bacterium]